MTMTRKVCLHSFAAHRCIYYQLCQRIVVKCYSLNVKVPPGKHQSFFLDATEWGGGECCCVIDCISRVRVWSADNNSPRAIIIVIILTDTINTWDQFKTGGVIFTLTGITIHFSYSCFCTLHQGCCFFFVI